MGNTALITNAYPATLYEAAYARAERQGRVWYVVYRPARDVIGITAKPARRDGVIMECEPDRV